MWKVNEIRSSGLLRQFLADGIALYKLHCATLDEDGEESVKEMSAEVVMASQQSEVVKVCYLMLCSLHCTHDLCIAEESCSEDVKQLLVRSSSFEYYYSAGVV